MRRMFSEKQIKGIIEESPSEVVEALKGQDISVEGITSKGIANTGDIGNIGDVAISGDLSVSGSINGEENPSVKPIYVHPITWVGQGNNKTRITLLILNNNSTPFTKETWCDYIESMPQARFLTSGYYDDGNDIYIMSYVISYSLNNISIVALNLTSKVTLSFDIKTALLTEDAFNFYDGVNKIN